MSTFVGLSSTTRINGGVLMMFPPQSHNADLANRWENQFKFRCLALPFPDTRHLKPDTFSSLQHVVKSATTSRAGDMRMAPVRGRGHLCWWPLIFKKNFLISVLSDLSVCDDDLTDSSWAVFLSASVGIYCWLFG